MTLDEIYNKISWMYFGDTTPAASVSTQFQAVTEGIIANMHRRIQEDDDYWFMENHYSVVVPAYTRTIALPSEFKRMIDDPRFFTFSSTTYTDGTADCTATTAVTGTLTAWDPNWSGHKYYISWDSGATRYPILSVSSATSLTLESVGPTASGSYTIYKTSGWINPEPRTPQYALRNNLDAEGYSMYPLSFDLWEDTVNIYPLASEAVVFDARYYGYLPRPTSFSTHDDALTQEAADLIVYMSLQELAGGLDDSKIQFYTGRLQQELQALKAKNIQRQWGGGMSKLKYRRH